MVGPKNERFSVNRAELASVFLDSPNREAGTLHVDVAEVVGCVIKHLADRLYVDDLLDWLPMSRRTLERRVRLHLGVSVQRMITLVRLEVARQMLIGTPLPVTDVAEQVGSSSHTQMCNVFRRELGCSPRELRRATDASGSKDCRRE